MFPTLALIFFLRRREPQSKTEVVVKKNFQVSRISRHLPHWGDLIDDVFYLFFQKQ
jgi:hypothetical protein